MRILVVTHYMPPHLGGIERVAESLAEGLRARGHEVRWVSSAVPEVPGKNGEIVRVRALNVLEEKLGVPYPIWSPSAPATMLSEVRRADVVHAHDCLYMGSALAAAACKATGTPLVLTQHVGYVPFGKALDLVQELAYRTLGRSVLAAATALVACAPHVPEYFRSLGVNRPFSLVRNGIDDTRFVVRTEADRAALRARAGIDPAAKVMLFSGRLVAKKGVAKVAEVQRALAAEGVTLVVAGDGPLAHLFEGLPSTVRLGAVSPERMPEVYAMADAYVLPSRGEGLPLGVQESLLSGTPVVVSDDPAFRDGLDGLAGVRFVSEGDALADVVREALAADLSRDEVRGSAKGAWGLDAFLTAYEGILGEAARSRFA